MDPLPSESHIKIILRGSHGRYLVLNTCTSTCQNPECPDRRFAHYQRALNMTASAVTWTERMGRDPREDFYLIRVKDTAQWLTLKRYANRHRPAGVWGYKFTLGDGSQYVISNDTLRVDRLVKVTEGDTSDWSTPPEEVVRAPEHVMLGHLLNVSLTHTYRNTITCYRDICQNLAPLLMSMLPILPDKKRRVTALNLPSSNPQVRQCPKCPGKISWHHYDRKTDPLQSCVWDSSATRSRYEKMGHVYDVPKPLLPDGTPLPGTVEDYLAQDGRLFTQGAVKRFDLDPAGRSFILTTRPKDQERQEYLPGSSRTTIPTLPPPDERGEQQQWTW